MMNFMKNNRQIIGILAILALFSIYSNAANAGERTNLYTKNVIMTEAATKVALSVSREEKLKKFENLDSLTDKQLVDLLSLVGFEGKALKQAWSIAKRESNGQPIRFNGNEKTGDNSYGLFQINMIGKLGPDRREKFELTSNSDLFNPVINAQIAFYMTDKGSDWSAWKGMTPRAIELSKNFPGA